MLPKQEEASSLLQRHVATSTENALEHEVTVFTRSKHTKRLKTMIIWVIRQYKTYAKFQSNFSIQATDRQANLRNILFVLPVCSLVLPMKTDTFELL